MTAPSPNSPDRPRHRIGKVARLLNMSTHALRAWERRYAVVVPERASGGGRLYSDHDVTRLSMIKRLTDFGHSISSVAALDESELQQRLLMHDVEPPQHEFDPAALRAEYLEALRGMDLSRAESTLMRGALTLDPRRFVNEVAAPLLTEVGAEWEREGICVAQEHAASAMLRSQLGALLRSFVRGEEQAAAVVTTPSGELHEFGALMAAVTAALAGFRVIYLGANLPAEEIARAARLSRARVVLVSLVFESSEVRGEVQRIARLLPEDTPLFVGGRAAAGLAPSGPIRVVRDLPELERALNGLLAAGGAGTPTPEWT